MTDPMETAITKREMQASFDAFLAVLMERLDKRFEQIDKRFDEVRRDMLTVVQASADELRLEIRAVNRGAEALHRNDIAVIDDKYKSLPARVAKLEAAVFKPAPLKRRRTR